MTLTASELAHRCIGLGVTRAFVAYRDRLSSRAVQTFGTGNTSSARAAEPSRCGNNRARKGGVHIVHTLGVGLGRICAGLGRFGEVFGGGQCLQGVKAGSSPTSGTRFPLSEAVLLSDCAQTGSDGEQGVPVSVGGCNLPVTARLLSLL